MEFTEVPMGDKAFASTGDVGEKTVSFTEIGPDLYAYTAEGGRALGPLNALPQRACGAARVA
jgi:hypothetical protein